MNSIKLTNPTITFSEDGIIMIQTENRNWLVPSVSDLYSTLRSLFGQGSLKDKANKLELKGLYKLYLGNANNPVKMVRLVSPSLRKS